LKKCDYLSLCVKHAAPLLPFPPPLTLRFPQRRCIREGKIVPVEITCRLIQRAMQARGAPARPCGDPAAEPG
jgi:hypothetical protein